MNWGHMSWVSKLHKIKKRILHRKLVRAIHHHHDYAADEDDDDDDDTNYDDDNTRRRGARGADGLMRGKPTSSSAHPL